MLSFAHLFQESTLLACLHVIATFLCVQPCSQLLFPSQRKENRAVQVVEVRAPSHHRQQPYTFTFCLERIDTGPYKVAADPAKPLTQHMRHDKCLCRMLPLSCGGSSQGAVHLCKVQRILKDTLQLRTLHAILFMNENS